MVWWSWFINVRNSFKVSSPCDLVRGKADEHCCACFLMVHLSIKFEVIFLQHVITELA